MSTQATAAAETRPYQVILLNVELSYPKLFEPKPYKNEAKLRYGANFILREATHADQIEGIKKQIAALLAEKKKKIRPENWCMRQADEEEYGPGAWEIRAYSQESRPPQVKRRDKSIATAKDDLFYGGAIVNGIIHLYENFDKINAGLDAVQFVKHGERKGRRPVDANKALPDLDDDDGDDGLS